LKLGAMAAGSRHEGGSPSLWQYAKSLYYLNHGKGLALAADGVTVADLQETLSPGRVTIIFDRTRLREFLSLAERAAVREHETEIVMNALNAAVRLPESDATAILAFFCGDDVIVV
jgi:hypothetical protein